MTQKADEGLARLLYEAHKEWCMKDEDMNYWGNWDEWNILTNAIRDEYYAMALAVTERN